jgi:TatD DNase family protein
MIQWLDAHTHLDSDELFSEKEEVLNRAFQSGVTRTLLVNSEATEQSFERTLICLNLSHPVKRFASFGIHPHQANLYDSVLEKKVKELLEHPGVVALGEIGLDFYYNYSPQDVQISVLRKQLALAQEKQLPVVIHCRDAYSELAQILSSLSSKWNGMIHCFTGTPAEMEPLFLLGFHISFSGIVTFPRAMTLKESAKIVPLDRILVETDAPFLAPVPHRGKRNEPAFVVETARFIASLRSISEEELSKAVFANFDMLFT